MKVDVPFVSDQTCKLEYPFSIAESMICAGERGKDSCQGDSGDYNFLTISDYSNSHNYRRSSGNQSEG